MSFTKETEMIGEFVNEVAYMVPGIGGLLGPVVDLMGVMLVELAKADDATEELASGINAMVDANKESYASYIAATDGIAQQAKYANDLIARYQNLMSVEGKSVFQQNEMTDIINELNTLYPKLGLSIMDVDGNLNQNIETVKKYVNGKKDEAQLALDQEYLNDLNKQSIEIEERKAEILDALGYTTGDLNEEEYERYINTEGFIGISTMHQDATTQEAAKLMTLRNEYFDLCEQQRAVTKETGRLSSVVDENTISTGNNTEETRAWNENLSIVSNEGLSGFVQMIQDKGPEASVALVEMAHYMRENGDIAFAELYEAIQGSAAEGVSAMETELSTDDAINTASNMIDENAVGVAANTSLEESVTDQVVNSKTAMAEQVMSSDFSALGKSIITSVMIGLMWETLELNSCVKAIIGSTKTSMANQVIASDFPSIGRSMIDGAIQGLNDKAPELYQAAEDIADNVAETLSDAFEVNSPSKVVYRIFESVGEGAILGLDSQVEAVKRKSDAFARASMDALAGGIYPGIANTTNTASTSQNIGPIVIQQPVKTPAEVARAIKREMVMLVG